MICLNKNGTSTLSNLDPINSDTAMRTLILNLGLSLGHMVLNNDRIMNNSDVETFLPKREYEDESDLAFCDCAVVAAASLGILIFAGVGFASLGP